MRFIGLLAATCVALGLAGCGSKPAPAPGLVGGNTKPAAPAATAPALATTPARTAPAPTRRAAAFEEAEGGVFLAGEPSEYGSRFAVGTRNADTFVARIAPSPGDGSTFVLPGVPAGSTAATPTNVIQGATGSNVLNANTAARGTPASGELPEGFTATPGAEIGPGGWPMRIRGEKDSAEMVFIEAGPSILGMDDGPEGTGPAVGVYLEAFYIDVHEVTSTQYESFRANQKVSERAPVPTNAAKDPLEPVTGVNWGEAQKYAKWAGKELPTEAQWEKAARGSEGFRAPWGNGVHLWHRPRTPTQLDAVGSFPTDISPYGVMDLAGNAREWCFDWYQPNAFDQLKAGKESTPRNPTGPKFGPGRVVKGGSSDWLAGTRAGVPMTDRPTDVGFRCVLNLKPPELPGKTEPDFGTKKKSARAE